MNGLRKSFLLATITQYLCGKVDTVTRRVWEDANGKQFVKIERMWHELDGYRRSQHHTVHTWFSC